MNVLSAHKFIYWDYEKIQSHVFYHNQDIVYGFDSGIAVNYH